MLDAAAFDQFYAETAARVVAQVYVMIGDFAEAEDAVQEAYARAWQRWGRVSGYADPTAWVRTVAYRVAVSSWRRSRTRLAAHLRSVDPRPAPDLRADTITLVDALRLIPLAQRRAIVLHHLVGMSVREIAAETGASESAVKAQLSRGRHALLPLVDDARTEVEAHD
ncbi:MAG TPA: sigma-70 family RNA polymerase sigma factor [Asanoa sp.]|jgi:RNA polymerase sigma-70 factor (ECF subfamily)|nr:sigma-70 family RNA polymerase sigma factor [Asanoa sp.]